LKAIAADNTIRKLKIHPPFNTAKTTRGNPVNPIANLDFKALIRAN
jgi:hypothetical protein